jgi:hypothetical protein
MIVRIPLLPGRDPSGETTKHTKNTKLRKEELRASIQQHHPASHSVLSFKRCSFRVVRGELRLLTRAVPDSFS